MLYTLHLVDTPAATVKLQDSVLANSLVNLKGLQDSNFELDRLLELLNNSLRCYQQERSYYSIHSDELLQNWAINGPYFQDLKTSVEAAFSRPNSGRHPIKSAAEDIWGMALTLAAKSLSPFPGDRFSLNPATDLFLEGLCKLGENVIKYNQQYTREVDTADDGDGNDSEQDEALTVRDQAPASPTIAADQHDGFDDIEDFPI